MATEQEGLLQVLRLAIDMETEGQKYYLQASWQSSSAMGRELLKSLAAEEDRHKQIFTGIYEAVRNQKAWPVIDLPVDRGKILRSIFTQGSLAGATATGARSSELDAVEVAIEMEVKSNSFYTSESRNARNDTEREFYRKLADEEHQHHLILLDYYEYLKDPAQWFRAKEHSSLDGG